MQTYVWEGLVWGLLNERLLFALYYHHDVLGGVGMVADQASVFTLEQAGTMGARRTNAIVPRQRHMAANNRSGVGQGLPQCFHRHRRSHARPF